MANILNILLSILVKQFWANIKIIVYRWLGIWVEVSKMLLKKTEFIWY